MVRTYSAIFISFFFFSFFFLFRHHIFNSTKCFQYKKLSHSISILFSYIFFYFVCAVHSSILYIQSIVCSTLFFCNFIRVSNPTIKIKGKMRKYIYIYVHRNCVVYVMYVSVEHKHFYDDVQRK